jgi:hypothetical protein
MSKIYLLSGLAQAQLSDLRQAGIDYSSWDQNTVSIEHSVLERTLQTLRSNASETATDFEGVVQLTLRPVSNNQAPGAHPERILTAEQRRSRENYIVACSARAAQAMEAAKEALEKQRQEFPGKVQRFILDKRDIAFCRTVPNETTLRETFDAQYQELLQTPKVVGVRVTAQDLLIYTDTLYATARDTGLRHELGKFLILINLDGKKGGIRWFNGDRRVNALRPGMNAPNVYEDGTAYQDELSSTFYELIARLQFVALADLAIQFIEEVDNDVLAPLISKWPLAAKGV